MVQIREECEQREPLRREHFALQGKHGMADSRTYTATVAHVWRAEKRRPDAKADSSQGEASADAVFQKKILLRGVQIHGLAADEQPARDEELEVFFHDEVRALPFLQRVPLLSLLFGGGEAAPCYLSLPDRVHVPTAVGRGVRVPG